MAWHNDGRCLGRSFLPAVVMVASLCAPGARAQVTNVAPYYANVQADKAPLRSGAGERFYSVANLPAGTILIVDGENQGWSRVLYPASTPAFVRAEDASLDGTTVKLTTDSRLRAASLVHGYAGSWQVLVDNALPAGAALTLIEPVKEGEVTIAYKVQPPGEARAFVATASLRRATDPEVEAFKAKGNTLAALPVAHETPTTGGTPNPGGLAIDLPKSDPGAIAKPTTTPSTTANKPATGSPTPTANPAGAQPVTALRAKAGDDLEPLFKKVWAEPVLTAEVDELIAQYEQAITTLGQEQAGRKPALQQRLNALITRREYRDSLRTHEAERAQIDQQTIRLQEQLKQFQRTRVYTIVGILQPSTVYDGQKLPLMYRVVSVGGTSPKTLGYIRKTAELDLDKHLGQIVGVVGETSIDRSLQLNLITPVVVDPLQNDAATGVPAQQPPENIDVTK